MTEFIINLKIIGERLKEIRKHLKLTQKQIAGALDVFNVTIHRIECGTGGSVDVFLHT